MTATQEITQGSKISAGLSDVMWGGAGSIHWEARDEEACFLCPLAYAILRLI